MSDLDQTLAAWPLPERAALERDEVAERVVDALRRELPATSRVALSDDALFAAPLPQQPGEGGEGAVSLPGKLAGLAASVENKMSKDRGRDRTSFQELAKLASLSPPPPSTTTSAPTPAPMPVSGVVRGEESNENDSGIVDLKAIASADPSGAHRAAATPLASQGLFDDDAPAVAPASAVAQAPAPATAAAAAAGQAASTAPALSGTKKEEKKKGGGGLVLLFGGFVAAAAIAAGGLLAFKHFYGRAGAPTPVAANTSTAAAPTATATAAATVAANDTSTPGAEVNLDAVPQGGGAPGAKPPVFKGGIAPKATATGGAPPPAGSVDPRLVVNNIPQGGGGGGGDLTNAMQAAAGGGSSTAAAANTASGPQYAPGSVPQKPSQGQVAGAIGAVLPDAKHCLNEGDPISRANVVFKSDGSVQAVTVSGFAAGKPAEACIKTALGKAKVSPFAEASYSFPVTVRP